jgi:hypothetical protein
VTGLIVAELVVGVLAGLTFAGIYWRRHWYGSAMGRHWMAVALITAGEFASLALLGLGVPVPEWLFAVGFGLLDALLIQRVWLLLRTE